MSALAIIDALRYRFHHPWRARRSHRILCVAFEIGDWRYTPAFCVALVTRIPSIAIAHIACRKRITMRNSRDVQIGVAPPFASFLLSPISTGSFFISSMSHMWSSSLKVIPKRRIARPELLLRYGETAATCGGKPFLLATSYAFPFLNFARTFSLLLA